MGEGLLRRESCAISRAMACDARLSRWWRAQDMRLSLPPFGGPDRHRASTVGSQAEGLRQTAVLLRGSKRACAGIETLWPYVRLLSHESKGIHASLGRFADAGFWRERPHSCRDYRSRRTRS